MRIKGLWWRGGARQQCRRGVAPSGVRLGREGAAARGRGPRAALGMGQMASGIEYAGRWCSAAAGAGAAAARRRAEGGSRGGGDGAGGGEGAGCMPAGPRQGPGPAPAAAPPISTGVGVSGAQRRWRRRRPGSGWRGPGGPCGGRHRPPARCALRRRAGAWRGRGRVRAPPCWLETRCGGGGRRKGARAVLALRAVWGLWNRRRAPACGPAPRCFGVCERRERDRAGLGVGWRVVAGGVGGPAIVGERRAPRIQAHAREGGGVSSGGHGPSKGACNGRRHLAQGQRRGRGEVERASKAVAHWRRD
jgi:hypothetical protein